MRVYNLVDYANGPPSISSIDQPAGPSGDRTAGRKRKRSRNKKTVDKISSDNRALFSKIDQGTYMRDGAVKFVNSKYNTHAQTSKYPLISFVSPCAAKNGESDDAGENRLGDTSVGDMSNPVTNPACEQLEHTGDKFERKRRTRLKEATSNETFELNELFSKADLNARKPDTVVKVVNSEYNAHAQKSKYPIVSLVPVDAATSVSIRSPSTSPICKKLQGSSPQSAVHSDTEVSGSLRRKNVSSCRRTCDRKPPQVYCIRNLVVVIMENDSRLCFYGKLLVKVLYGAVKIHGSTLDRSIGTAEVYSPRGYSNIVIETSEEFPEGSVEDVWMALAAENITRDSESKLQIDVDNVQPGMAVLELRNLENNLTLFLKTYFPHLKLFPSVKNPHYFPWTDPKRAEIILQATLCVRPGDKTPNFRQLATEPCVTVDIAERMLSLWYANTWSCTLIAGGKDVGKSTNVRYLINSLLRTSKKVVLVDVDPGQAECTPPGCISYSLIEEPLLGPNFTHLKTPVYQLFLDDVDVSRCLTRYLEGIKMLIDRLRECPVLSRLPIVVNTMGFAQKLGWNIMMFTIKLIRPSIILQILSRYKKNNYINYLSAEVVNQQEYTWTFCDEKFIDWNRPCEHDLCVINSRAEVAFGQAQIDRMKLEPYQQRELMMMSYLSGIVRERNYSLQCNTGLSVSINEVVPYTAPFSSLCIIPQRLFGVPASRALSVINGNIVALCGIDLTEESSQESSPSTLRVLTQRSPLCTCYGFGIVRGVDMERQEVFINTPLPISMMPYVNCLAGSIPVPPTLLQLQQGAPYVGENADDSLPTSREPRKGHSRMRDKNKPSKSV
ncbi:PREDICTED: polynucleotide 5'-hydroxyl-kinase NOL9 isoform X2 [Vollenhovia emeryi]|nr:PREDICTED: polynucleotide 5'-hydroxyl-kinase NOL9 isoform X2 [Vollenhovia emeryi]